MLGCFEGFLRNRGDCFLDNLRILKFCRESFFTNRVPSGGTRHPPMAPDMPTGTRHPQWPPGDHPLN